MTRTHRSVPGDPFGPRSGSTPGGGGSGSGGIGLPIAPILALAGLLVVALATLSLTSGYLPFGAGPGGGNGGGPTVAKTPTPSNIVVVPEDPRAHIPGTIVYAKDGNIWLQSGATATQLTTDGTDSQPSFSSDGQTVFFIRTRQQHGLWPTAQEIRPYLLTIPTLMKVGVGGGTPVKLLDGIVDPAGQYVWTGWIREPVVSPDGTQIALVSDLPQPDRSDVVVQLFNVATGKLTNLGFGESQPPHQSQPLGHQDPAWRPDGKVLLYVRNDSSGSKGSPQIYAWKVGTKTAPAALTAAGYLHPAYSADGRWIAATRTTAIGTDIVILDGTTGAEVLRVTNDGNSWGPTWSPKGDAIAFLHVNGQVVDLRLVNLTGNGPGWTLGDALDLTTGAGLDSLSRPDWFIPADELPKPTATPTAVPSGVSSSSPAPS